MIDSLKALLPFTRMSQKEVDLLTKVDMQRNTIYITMSSVLLMDHGKSSDMQLVDHLDACKRDFKVALLAHF